MSGTPELDVAGLVERWWSATLTKDIDAASALRDDSYSATLPNGTRLSKTEELALIASDRYGRLESFEISNLRVDRARTKVTARFDCLFDSDVDGAPTTNLCSAEIVFVHRSDRWLALESRLTPAAETRPPLRERLAQSARSAVRKIAPSFGELAYFPFQGTGDFAIPLAPARERTDLQARLPMPPPELWLGYNYPASGKPHVDTMLRIVAAAGLQWQRGDRILDLGCGAGRMIRHLAHLAETCEIWGMDISAAHIFWCRENLSPPFRFATTTRVPHLPFEDRSFRFIYCGSVFTHIDDLTEAWLLELHRILVPGGMLYVTIHDQRTVEIIESRPGGKPTWLEWVRSRPVYRDAKGSFNMLSVNRDSDPQVFYDRDFFCRMLSQSFDVLSVHPEAYAYQTAILAGRRAAPDLRTSP